MLATDLVPGRKYALREQPRQRGPLLKVVFSGPVRAGKAKIRWVDGEREGLEEWLHTRCLVCLWSERAPFLRDEQCAASVNAAGKDVDGVLQGAISEVMTATGESGGFMNSWSDPPDRVRRLWARAGLPDDPLDEPLAYMDRHGRAHLSALTALRWSKAFAAAEPQTVGLYLEQSERALLAEGFRPGDRFAHELLRQSLPAHAVIRDWAAQPERGLLRAEVERLQKLVHQAVGELERLGATNAAGRLSRGLAGS